MTGVKLWDGQSMHGGRRRGRRLAVYAASIAITVGVSTGLLPSAATAEDVATCSPVPPSPEAARTINLVLDESGSMFFNESGNAIDRWSFAKYSLEVFAALMGPGDTLNVYRMSDFSGDDPATGPTLTLTGSTPVADRVAEVHDLELVGLGTPYESVTVARDDLVRSVEETGDANNWLVILTDGEFYRPGNQQVSPSEVSNDLRALCEKGISVAFMSIGQGAPAIKGTDCVQFVKATDSTDLIKEMTGFSNKIFNRALADEAGTTWDLDIPLQEVKVFAQGADVSIGAATTSRGSVEPSSTATVSWTTNPDVETSTGNIITPTPNRALEGVVATFEDIPAGAISLDISNYKDLAYFYKPAVSFGAYLTDSSGTVVPFGQTFAGESYTVTYGFMDESCQVVQSPLLGDVQYEAQLRQGAQDVQSGIRPGDSVILPEGESTLHVVATGAGLKAEADIVIPPRAAPPGAPNDVIAAPGDSSALVSWTPPESVGAGPVTSYTVTSNPPGFTCTTSGELSCQVEGLENGVEYTFTVTATNEAGYEGLSSEPSNPVTPFKSVVPDYLVSQMEDYPPIERGMRISVYVVSEDGSTRPITQEEWTGLDEASIQVTADGAMEFDVLKQDQVGVFVLLPRAPDGDIYAASTGPLVATLTLPADERFNFRESSVSIPFNVIDDISAWDRWKNWFFTTGLKLLIGLVLLIILLGYIFKKRFPKRIKKGPMINGRPRVIGPQAINAPGRFQKNSLRQFLPFFADKATLTYVPFGVMGFAPLQLKAGPSKMLKLENWRQIASQGNVQINGVALDDNTTTQPVFHAGAPITAETPQMTYDMSATQ